MSTQTHTVPARASRSKPSTCWVCYLYCVVTIMLGNAMLSVSMRRFLHQQIAVDGSGRLLSLALELAAGLTD